METGVFHERLRSLVSGKVQAQEARELGISASGFHHWLSGRSEPGVTEIRRLAEKYEVSADWLLGLSEDRWRSVDVPQRPLTEPCDSIAHEVLAAYTLELRAENARLLSALADRLPSGIPTDWLGAFVRMVSQHATESAEAPDSGGDHLGGTTEEGRPGAGPQEGDRGGGPGRARRR